MAKASNPGVEELMWHTAGGRIRFATNSPYIAIKAVMPETEIFSTMAKAGQSGFDLFASRFGRTTYVSTFMPPPGITSGYESCADVSGDMVTYTIHMPLYDGVNELYIGLSKNAEIAPADPYFYPVPVLYYGSSITQGGCASIPGGAYQAIISRKYDADFINLGFSGSGKAEKAMVEYLASLDASVFVCDYDHNAPDETYLEATHWPLYETYRAARPDTPIVFITRPDFFSNWANTPKRWAVIHETYRKARAAGDNNVYFIDGRKLFEGDCWDICTVDGCHPNDLGFYRMAQGIGDVVGKLLEK
ncbi:MAG: hypothetical protein IJX14_01270 [Clostridia bacterium]|nr:hypothetical protein [Clostridia bacterium]